MVFVEDKCHYPDYDTVWKDMCKLSYLEGVGAFLSGMTDMFVYDLEWPNKIANTDFILRFFDERIGELKSAKNKSENEITWLKELALLAFTKCCKLIREDPHYPSPEPPLELLSAIFTFFCNNKIIEF